MARLKLLHQFILKSFFPSFVGAFLVTWFIWIMQFFWLWIDEFIGKGLDFSTLIHFIALESLTLITISLPLGVLFAAIMSFGNLAESYELVAVKSAGISIIRFAMPLIICILLLSVGLFFFNNNIVTAAQIRATRLLYDISNTKPAVAIKAGSFYSDIPNQTIYIGSKENDNETIHDIKIYDHTSGRGNDKMILAKHGKMYVTEDKHFLVFELKDGWRYEEKIGNNDNLGDDQIRLGFEYWKKVFDLSDFKMNKTSEDYFKNMRQVMTASQLKKEIDSNEKKMTTLIESTNKILRPNLFLLRNTKLTKHTETTTNTTLNDTTTLLPLLPDTLKSQVLVNAEITARNIKSSLEINKQNNKLQRINLTDNRIAFYQRFSLSYSCFVLFLIGAALGSIIRKGGLGMPFIAAVLFFVFYYFLTSLFENYVKGNRLPAWLGIFFPSILLTGIAIFLLIKANNDSPLLNKEWYFRLGNKIVSLLHKKSKNTI